MSTIARQALENLLRRAENASAKNATDRAINLCFTNSSFPAYLKLGTHAEKESCHGELQLAVREGVITIEWERQAGEKNQIKNIKLSDPAALANFLGVTPRWDAVAAAERELLVLIKQYPVLQEVVEMWRRGMKPRGTTTGDVKDWIIATRVIEYCKNSDTLDIPVRRISTKLTCDSKRVEKLWDVIDVLLQGDLHVQQRSAEEVFAEIGLIKYPPTILIAGDVSVLIEFDRNNTELKIERPYLGLSPSAITGFVAGNVPVTLLTVENLTTFHELAAITESSGRRILLYTGGMPSPSWKRIYRLLLDVLPKMSHIFHWGDIDAGGFRIANHLAASCKDAGRFLELHMMGFGDHEISSGDAVRRDLTDKEVIEIGNICQRWGWASQYDWVSKNNAAIEQESLPATWPKVIT